MNKPTAIVVGSGRGIGRAIAQELAASGHNLALVARTMEELEETRALIGHGLILRTDITDPKQVDNVTQQTLKSFGRIDVLVNSAGTAPALTIDQIAIDQWHQILNTNLSAVFYACKSVWPTMVKQKAGVIVNISSLASRDPFSGLGAYGAAKAGVNLLSLSLAREGEEHNIRVHTLALGSVETAMFRRLMSPELYPKEKTMDPADVAKVVGDCVRGSLRYTSGEVIYLHKTQ
jgi:3-oxoacyl-[acyl-carrier protein] reductase